MRGGRPASLRWAEVGARASGGTGSRPPWTGPAIGGAVAVALGLTGRTTAAVVLLAVVVTLAIASAASARFAHGMGRVLAAVGHAAGRALAWLLLGLVTLLLIVPVWAVGRLGRWAD